MLAFKVFRPGRKGKFQCDFKYPPVGKWTKKEKPVLCQSGFHVSNSFKNLPFFLEESKDQLWIVEAKGKSVGQSNKVSFAQIRMVRQLPLTSKLLKKIAKRLGIHLNFVDYYEFKRHKKTFGKLLGEVCERLDEPLVQNIFIKELGISRQMLLRRVTHVIKSNKKRKRTNASI